MALFKRLPFLFVTIIIGGFFSNAFAVEKIDFMICTESESKRQYAVIERNMLNEKSYYEISNESSNESSNENSNNDEAMINNLAPVFLAKGYYIIPNHCEKIDLESLTNQFPRLKGTINQYLALEDKFYGQPLLVPLPTQLTNSDSINKVRPVIIATSLTFALLWALGSSYLAPGCLIVFITCAFRPEQCQTVLSNFSDFFSELWSKIATNQIISSRAEGHKLGK